MKIDKKNRTENTRGRDDKCKQNCSQTQQGNIELGSPTRRWDVKIQRILRKEDMKVWPGFAWLKLWFIASFYKYGSKLSSVKKACNFLISRAITTFSRCTLSHGIWSLFLFSVNSDEWYILMKKTHVYVLLELDTQFSTSCIHSKWTSTQDE
jgi:hypothetical protein